jgi:hypothetical protein
MYEISLLDNALKIKVQKKGKCLSKIEQELNRGHLEKRRTE